MSELRRLWDQAVQAAEVRGYIAGRLGKADASGNVSILVENRPNHLYVSLGPEGDQGVTIARNMGAPRIAWVPIRLKRERGELYIVGLDHTPGRLEAFFGGQTAPGSVDYHTHRIGSGLEYEVEALRLEPGRVVPTTGMIVGVNAFRYYYNGAWDTWEAGSTLDLTSYKPASGKWAWVVVGVNPATNALVAVKGTDQDAQADLTDALIDSVSFSDYIPCGAVQLSEADTSVTDIARWQDARGWINQPVADLDGVPGVTIASETENDSFWYDGSGWVNGRGHRLNMASVQALTISGGTLNIDGTDKQHGLINVQGEGGADDQLDTISGGVDGDIIVLWAQYTGASGRITVTDNDNINVPSTGVYLPDQYEVLVLLLTGDIWQPVNLDTRLDDSTVTVQHSFDVYIDLKERQAEQHIHGNFIPLATGQPLDSTPTNIAITNGLSKLVIVVNAGSDVTGEITVTGTSVDRNTGTETASDTDVITVDALTTDASSTDANGNTEHDFTGAYITSKWFAGAVTLSTADLTLTDVDVYQVSFEQFGDKAVTIQALDVTAEANNTAAWCDLYFYLLEVTGDKCDIASIADVHVTTAESTADRYYRLRRGNLATACDGTTDGIWIDGNFGPLNQNYWEDINIKLWYDVEVSLTPGA